ncbi:expansin-like protein [Cavenderia fasciculata]|uniref:Expansin-like protein n=1 Tax=Cavenderia fasciculata TaxID=261658 RepID=F4Q6M8_CACFS|nr:expansin-like protein [Cavenderia fasciculata]EGG16538.1 expansin-like protein [Cavenderia fasciculata]|eukprot:XP_004354938.1 expansin-like protein [Cavenderia fasciculata]
MRILILLLSFIYIVNSTNTSVPLTQCMSGKVIGTEPLTVYGSCGYGSYNGETTPGTMTATLNQIFYASARCGDCFEITGPKGSTVVRAVNFCGGNECSNDRPYFMTTPNAFSEISDEPLSTIYDAGFRRVSCPTEGPLKVRFQNDTSEYYVNVLLFNNNVGISSVSIKGANMPNAAEMNRQNNSATFSWSQAGFKIQFPATVTATSLYGDKVSVVLKSSDRLKVYEFGKNFAVPQKVVGSPATCLLAKTPTCIYNDSFSQGYDTWSSYSYKDLNVSDTTVTYNKSKASLHINLIGAGSYLSITRAGQFQTDYFKGIKFAIRASRVWNGFNVFFGQQQESCWKPSTNITTEWSEHTVLFSDMKHQHIEKAINFGNKNENDVIMWLDDISFITSPNAPNITAGASAGSEGLNPMTNQTTTTMQMTGTPYAPSEDPTVHGSHSGDEMNHESSAIKSNSTNISIIFVLLFVVLSMF